MSSVIDVSDRLGEYMLKGWVLTDKSCPTPGCSVPLMRSPSGRTPIIHFCANCDNGTGVPQPTPTISISDSSSTRNSASQISRSSTPPTEVSSVLSSPVFAPPVETEESIRRREQSDRASQEIGKRLLKGWAMLGDECTNSGCYGVPLVRPPKTGGEKDPRKVCVICGSVYLTEIDWDGRERLISAGLRPVNPDASGVMGTLNPHENTEVREEPTPIPRNTPAAQLAGTINTSGSFSIPGDMHLADNSTQAGGVQETLEVSSRALQSTIHTLSAHLSTLSSMNGYIVDPSSIGLTADTIGKVTQALSYVRQLQWSESQAQRL
ncbi:hypothetical protein BDZ94DRAFT_1304250 [Collybia nuda]|uniref:Uncharacterized protein n=1 Tax=Collybia nuda TaxID=64659 RepID=A0A9P5YI62_9AGAR|nr:hypothetical protein BDZ94DRAFT_1304250 [Collybia nuda]